MKRTGFLKRGKRLSAKRDPKLVAWSRAVKKRDGNRCQWPACPYQGSSVTLDAHHKAPRSQRPDLRLDPDNGITICRYHHSYTHTEGKAEAIALGILIETTYEAARKSA